MWCTSGTRGVSDATESGRFPCWQSATSRRIASGAGWSVSAVWISIGNRYVFSGSVSVSDRSSVILRGHSSRLLFFFFGLEGLNHTKKKKLQKDARMCKAVTFWEDRRLKPFRRRDRDGQRLPSATAVIIDGTLKWRRQNGNIVEMATECIF